MPKICGDGEKKHFEILHVVNKWAIGGVERFIEDLIDECTNPDINQSVLSICTPIGSRIKCLKYGPMYDGTSMPSMLKGAIAFSSFLGRKHYDIVHIHTQNSSGFLYANIAKHNGVGLRIIHSHNTCLGTDAGIIKKVAQVIFRILFSESENCRMACSTEAGNHLFPKKSFMVIPNGINTVRFTFDPVARKEVRSLLDINDDIFLVGCVGTLIEAKNHIRAISVFNELYRENPNSKMVILGEGQLRSHLEMEVVRRGLDGLVAMPGFVNCVYRWYNAMDALLFPSLYEGFPISLVEAQCNGLPVICSDSVTREIGLLDTCCFLSLEDPDADWSRALLRSKRDFTGASAVSVSEKGFDREETIKCLIRIYEGGPSEQATLNNMIRTEGVELISGSGSQGDLP